MEMDDDYSYRLEYDIECYLKAISLKFTDSVVIIMRENLRQRLKNGDY